MTFYMPDPEEARFYGITDDFDAYRVWWSVYVMELPVREETPEPGALPLADDENG